MNTKQQSPVTNDFDEFVQKFRASQTAWDAMEMQRDFIASVAIGICEFDEPVNYSSLRTAVAKYHLLAQEWDAASRAIPRYERKAAIQ